MKFNAFEKENIQFLQSHGISFATVRLTENILNHAIFDANNNIRTFLLTHNLHDYEKQGLGKEFKVFLKTEILTFKRSVETKTSLYRARSRGDYRMWFGSAIFSLSESNDLYIITTINKELRIINISKIDLDLCYKTSYPNPIKDMVTLVSRDTNVGNF